MKTLYTSSDLERWREVFEPEAKAKSLQILEGRKRNHSRGWLLQGAKHLCRSLAMIRAAQMDFPNALGWLRRAVECEISMYDEFRQGLIPMSSGYITLGSVMDLIHAHATRDAALMDEMNRALKLEYGEPVRLDCSIEQTCMCKIVKALTERRIKDAVALVENPPQKGKKVTREWVDAWQLGKAEEPMRLEKTYPGWFGVVSAIAYQDEVRLRSAVRSADEKWFKWARSNVRGSPESVCFLQGVGLVRLAEWVWERPVAVESPNIPLELLAPHVRPAEVPRVLPD